MAENRSPDRGTLIRAAFVASFTRPRDTMRLGKEVTLGSSFPANL